jgi:hypothetical protein
MVWLSRAQARAVLGVERREWRAMGVMKGMKNEEESGAGDQL